MVSSTCYDLAPIREMLGRLLGSFGFDVLLSERSDFPTLPHLTTFDNTRRAAREMTDVLILVIGGRRGSTAPGSTSSITNVEYREARQAGIPILVFVQQRVLDALPIWRNTPTADFSTHADSTDIFQFVEEVQAENRWVTGFANVEGIEIAIRDKLSHLFRYLLDLRRGIAAVPNAEYQNESAHVRDLLITQPDAWEFKLFVSMVRDRLKPLMERLSTMRRGIAYFQVRKLGVPEYVNVTSDLFQEIQQIPAMLVHAISDDYPAAIGEPGTPSDLPKLRECANHIGEACKHAIAWEERLRSILPPDGWEKVHEISCYWGGDVAQQVSEFFANFDQVLNDPNLSGEHRLNLEIDSPRDFEQWQKLFEELAGEYE